MPKPTYGGISAGYTWEDFKDPPTDREIRTGQAFRDGQEHIVRDYDGHYVGEASSSPREIAKTLRQARLEGRSVFVDVAPESAQPGESDSSFLGRLLGRK